MSPERGLATLGFPIKLFQSLLEHFEMIVGCILDPVASPGILGKALFIGFEAHKDKAGLAVLCPVALRHSALSFGVISDMPHRFRQQAQYDQPSP